MTAPASTSRRLLPRALLAGMALGLMLAMAPAAGAAETSAAVPESAPIGTDSGAAEPAEPADRVTWGVEPVAGADGMSRVSFRHELDPGDKADDILVVRNFADREVTFELYARDGVTTADGQFDIAQADQPSTDAGAWITVSQTSVTIPAQGSAEVPFQVSVPATATPGDHPAGIVATVSTAGTGSDGAAVSVERRVGARVHLRVSGELTPALTVEGLTTSYTGEWSMFGGGRLRTTFTVVNTGNVRLGGQGVVTVSGPFGLAATTLALTPIPEILPGAAVPVDVEFSGVPPLFLASAEVTITATAVAADPVMDVAPAAAGARAAAIPWAWILTIAIAALVVANVLLSRSRWRRKLAAAVAAAKQADPLGADTADSDTAEDPVPVSGGGPRHR